MNKNVIKLSPLAIITLGFVLVFLLPKITDFMYAFADILSYAIIIGGAGYLFYSLYKTKFLERVMEQKVTNYENPPPLNSANHIPALPEPAEKKELTQQLNFLNNEVQYLKQQNQHLKGEVDDKIEIAVSNRKETIKIEAKKEVLGEILNEDISNQIAISNPDDRFEKQEHLEKIKKKEESLEIRDIQISVAETLHNQNVTIFQMNERMSQGFLELTKGLISLKEFTVQRFSDLEKDFFNGLSSVNEEISGLKLQYGQEFLRMDKTILGAISTIEEYRNEVKQYGIEMIRVQQISERNNESSKMILERAKNLQDKYEGKMQNMGGKLELTLQKIAVENESFAATVGKSKNELDAITRDQQYALKDIAYAKVGAERVVEEYGSRMQLEQ